MEVERHISETAFLANESKARRVEISRDIFSKLWTTPATAALWEEFAAASCTYDDIELSLRSRFFLDRAQAFLQQHSDPVFVNIASGFSSYPLLLNAACRCVEIDFPHVIKFKTGKLAEWQEQRRIPARNVDYLAADLCDDRQWGDLESVLSGYLKDQPSFVLLEGISYYLPLAKLQSIFAFLAQTQTAGSQTAVEYWRPDLPGYPAFQKLEHYFSSRFQFPKGRYTFLEESFFENLQGFRVVEFSGTRELEPQYSSDLKLGNREGALPAGFCLLERSND